MTRQLHTEILDAHGLQILGILVERPDWYVDGFYLSCVRFAEYDPDEFTAGLEARVGRPVTIDGNTIHIHPQPESDTP